MNKEKN